MSSRLALQTAQEAKRRGLFGGKARQFYLEVRAVGVLCAGWSTSCIWVALLDAQQRPSLCFSPPTHTHTSPIRCAAACRSSTAR
jgi:hypothetical protein